MTTKDNSIDLRCICRCCGWDFGDYCPWGDDGASPEYVICDCCGCEAGNDDSYPGHLAEYRRNWLNSGAQWWHRKTKPVDWNDGRQLKEQLERIAPKKRLHQVPNFSPFDRGGYKTPDDAIAAGKRIDSLRKHELKLDVDPIKGKVVKNLHWSATEIALEFDADLYLVLASKPDKIDAFIATKNIDSPYKWYENYEIISDDGKVWEWSPFQTAGRFIRQKFANIQMEYRFAWLYFQQCPELIQVVQCAIQESDTPILTWESGT